jgi:hypothetical protein
MYPHYKSIIHTVKPPCWFTLDYVQGQLFKMLYVDVTNIWRQAAAHCQTFFVLVNTLYHLKICGSQTDFQQFHDGLNWQCEMF